MDQCPPVFGSIRRMCVQLACGTLVGFLLVALFRYEAAIRTDNVCDLSKLHRRRSYATYPTKTEMLLEEELSDHENRIYTDKNLVLVGVMTAKDFLQTRVVAAYNTWVKSIPGEVLFFSSENLDNVTLPEGVNVVALKGVDDVYPPQKKAFLMLKYMHDFYLDKYKFFVRADDDVYVKGDYYGRFLHSLNSTRADFPVVGSTGFGNKEEMGKLNLKAGENYCMGGPGMIMTREVLARTVPHISSCLKNLYSTHEDVEIGRCIQQFANVTCTWSYQKTLYHNYKEPKGSFKHSLQSRDIKEAATLHPVKEPAYVYRMHQHALSLRSSALRNRLQKLKNEIVTMNKLLRNDRKVPTSDWPDVPSFDPLKPRTAEDIVQWDFTSKTIYSTYFLNPKRRPPLDKKTGEEEVSAETLIVMNKMAAAGGPIFKYKNISYYYSRTHPVHGQQYFLGADVVPRKSAKPKVLGPVRSQILARRPFLETEFFERNASNLVWTWNASAPYRDARSLRVNCILPLAGRYSTFLRFMKNFENVCLTKRENVSLSIVIFEGIQNDTTDDVISYIERLKPKYNQVQMTVVPMNGSFSRAIALQTGSDLFSDDDLLFFVDVDLILHESTLQRIRLNTVQGQTVYAPIFFSRYDPNFIPRKSMETNLKKAANYFSPEIGYWRQYSFGMISAYKSDFKQSGGFKQDIVGWGLEDIDLLEKFISSNVSVFRSADIGMLHPFHPILCDPNLEISLYTMCIGTRVTTYGSTNTMADIVFKAPDIINRNQTHNMTTSVRPNTTYQITTSKSRKKDSHM